MQNATDLAKFPYVAPSNTESESNTNPHNLGAPIIPYVAQMTTSYLQKNQTDFHILPSCNATKCVASGSFVNDDGVTLNLTQRNTYTFSYEHDVVTTAPVSPTLMTVTVTTTGLKKMINANDLLNKIEIYDATTFGMDLATGATYSVAVNFLAALNKDPQSLGDAAWAEKGDKLEILAPNHWAKAALASNPDPIDLTEVATIVFTKK